MATYSSTYDRVLHTLRAAAVFITLRAAALFITLRAAALFIVYLFVIYYNKFHAKFMLYFMMSQCFIV